MQSEHTPQDVVGTYFAALNAGDAQGITALFAEDGVLMAEGYPSVAGQDQIRQMFEGTFAAMRMDRDWQVDDVREGDGIAVVRTHSNSTSTLIESGTITEQDLRELYVLQRSTDGWRIGQYIFNSPTPPPSP